MQLIPYHKFHENTGISCWQFMWI